jgi:hypothetical protein
MDPMFPSGTVCTPSSAFFVAFEARNILSFWAGWILKFSISIRSTDETQVKQIMEEVVTGNIGENPYTSIPTLTCIICDSAINNSNCEVCSICNNICHNQCLVEINGVYETVSIDLSLSFFSVA